MDGANGIERCEAVTAQVLQAVFAELDAHHVLFDVAAAQQALLKRCHLNGLARDGKYSRERMFGHAVPGAAGKPTDAWSSPLLFSAVLAPAFS
jgi:hypothetical protein